MIGEFEDTSLVGNEQIEEAIHRFYKEQTPERFMDVCLTLRKRITKDWHLLFPVDMGEDEDGNQVFTFKTLEVDEVPVMVAFTSLAEKQKGPPAGGLSNSIDSVLEPLMQMDEIGGLLLNPWGESLCLGKEDIAVILNPGVERFL